MPSHYSAERFRRNLLAFLIGRVGSGLLGFVNFLLLARLLAKEEFGVLVALMASAEIIMSLASFGLEWVASVFLPAYRLGASSVVFWRFVLRVTSIIGLSLGGFTFLAWLLATHLTGQLGLTSWARVFELYLIVAWMDGMLRFLKDTVLETLLMQWAAQLSVALKNLFTLSYLVAATAGVISLDIFRFVQLEIVAFLIALSVAIVALLIARRREGDRPAVDPQWVEPGIAQMYAVARHNYGTTLIAVLSAPNLIMLAIERFLGIAATATFGFVRTLSEQIRKYLPSELFYGIVRTIVIAGYVQTGDRRQLAFNHAIFLKVSLLPLALLSGLTAAYGGSLVKIAGGQKYAGAEWLLFCLLGVLLLFVLRRNIELFLNTTQNSRLLVRSALGAVISLPIGLGFLASGGTLYHLVAAQAIGELAAIGLALIGIRRRRLDYMVSWAGIVRLFIPALAWGVLFFRFAGPVGGKELILGMTTLLALIGGTQWLLQPFNARELTAMRSMATALRRPRGPSTKPGSEEGGGVA